MSRSLPKQFVLCIYFQSFLFNQISSKRHEIKLDDKFIFGWEVNESNGSIEIDGTGETLGYVGIGLSTKGKMDKAEMSIGGVYDDDGKPYYGIYTGRHHKVKLDKKKDWKLLEAKQNETHTYVKYFRQLGASYVEVEAEDTNNIPIKDKDIYVIWALGNSDKIKKHHGHGKFKVNLIHPAEDFLAYLAEDFYNFAFLNL